MRNPENNDNREICFYCGAYSPKSGVGDHFPIPDRNGGTLTVPCCQSCHQMKDNVPFDRWPSEWAFKILGEFSGLSRETKLFLAKSMSVTSDALKIINNVYTKDKIKGEN